MLIVMSSVVGVQVPLEIVHRNVADVPGTKLLTPVVGNVASAKVAAPLITVHKPEPMPAELALMLLVVVLHKFWSAPAAAVVGVWSTCIVTLSVVDGQFPLAIVHFNMLVAPAVKPVMPDVSLCSVVMIAEPDTTLHVPTPMAAVFPVSAVVAMLHSVWSAPASAVVGNALLVMVMLSALVEQPGDTTIHVSVTFVPAVKPVTVVVGDRGVVIVAVPLVSVHVPTPTVGVFPLSCAVT